MSVQLLLKLFRRYETPLILGAIFIAALLLRLYHLGVLPYGLHEDELMNGYVGRFILLNGKDLYGNRWPLLYFNNFGDYPPVIPMYFSGLGTFLLGVSAFAIRFPIAVAGSIAIFPMYFVTTKVFVKRRYGYVAALFLAILPWHIILSRATAENVTATMFHLWSLYFLLQYVQKRKIRDLILAVLLVASKYFLYASFRVTVPLSFFAAVILAQDKKWRLICVSLGLLFLLTTFGIGRTTWGQGRFKQTSLFYFNNTLSNRSTVFSMEEGQSDVLVARIFHNKPVVYAREFLRQYLSYFSTSYLFTDGGLPGRYLMSDTGVLYISFAIFAVASFLTIVLTKKDNLTILFTKDGRIIFLYLIIVLLLSPVPSALTLDDVPNVHRSLMVGVMLIFPITFFFASLEVWKWRKLSVQMLGLVLVAIECIYFLHQFTNHVPYTQSIYRGDDRTTLAKYLGEHHNDYDVVYLPHDAKPLYYLFYTNNFDKNLAGQFGPNISLDKVDNLVFTSSNCPTLVNELAPTAQSLVVARGECALNSHYVKIGTIKRIGGSDSFGLFRIKTSKFDTAAAKIIPSSL